MITDFTEKKVKINMLKWAYELIPSFEYRAIMLK